MSVGPGRQEAPIGDMGAERGGSTLRPDEDLDRFLRKRLIEAEEKELERRCLPVRDAETGAFTLELWLHSLETVFGEPLRRSTPISRIVFEVLGIKKFAGLHSAPAAHRVLASIVRSISSNLRACDIVCRSGRPVSGRHRFHPLRLRSGLNIVLPLALAQGAT